MKVEAYLWTFLVVLVNATANFEAALELSLRHPGRPLLMQDDGDGEAGDGGAGLVGEGEVHDSAPLPYLDLKFTLSSSKLLYVMFRVLVLLVLFSGSK